MTAAVMYRLAAADWTLKGWTVPPAKASGMITRVNVHIDEAIKPGQFWLLWIVLGFDVTADFRVIGIAKTKMSEIFGSTLPGIVEVGFVVSPFSWTRVQAICRSACSGVRYPKAEWLLRRL